MNSTFPGVKSPFNTPIRLLNQPLVKEGVKNIAGSVTFVFGLVEIIQLFATVRPQPKFQNFPKWVQVVNKVVIVCAKISLILSAGVSRPGVFILSSLIGRVFSTAQLDRVFGPNTIFAVNPWHPRHLISIVAVILAIPSVIQSSYFGINCKKIRQYQNVPINNYNIRPWLTLFNAITSRPTLHIVNQLGRCILHSPEKPKKKE